MKISLIFPPVSPQYFMPYLSVPALGAYLKQEEPSWDVRMEDPNIGLAMLVMAPEGIERFKKAFSRQAAELPGSGDRKWFADWLEKLVNIETFLDRHRDQWRSKNPDEGHEKHWFFLKNLKDIDTWLGEILIAGVDVKKQSQEQTLEWVEKYPEGIMTEYFRDEVVPRLIKFSPDLLGFSWIDHGQVLPTLVLLKILKEQGFTGRTVVGGPYISLIWSRLEGSPITGAIDHFIYRQGEEPLLRLARSVAKGEQPRDIGELLEPDGADISVLPPPDFGDFPLDDYFFSERKLCLLGSWGCYWGDCSFCNVRKLEGISFKSRTPAMIASDMLEIKKRYSPGHVRLSDNAVSFSYMVKIARELIERDVKLPWITNTRFDGKWTEEGTRLMAESNCVQLLFGLESASDNIMNLVNKGTDLDQVRNILSTIEPTRIWVHFYMIVGYPSETREDWERTLDFFRSISKQMPKLRFSTHLACFGLQIQSHIYDNPEKHHISEIIEPDVKGWEVNCDYRVDPSQTNLLDDRSIFYEMEERLDKISHNHLRSQMTLMHRVRNRLWMIRNKFGF